MIETETAWAIMGIIVCLAFIISDIAHKRGER